MVYDSFIRPTVMQYEPNIEQRLEHLRANSGQLIAFYIKNFADKGTAFFMDFLRYVVSERPEAAANSEPVINTLLLFPTSEQIHRDIIN